MNTTQHLFNGGNNFNTTFCFCLEYRPFVTFLNLETHFQRQNAFLKLASATGQSTDPVLFASKGRKKRTHFNRMESQKFSKDVNKQQFLLTSEIFTKGFWLDPWP